MTVRDGSRLYSDCACCLKRALTSVCSSTQLHSLASPRDYSSLSAQSPAPIPTNSHHVSDLELFGLRVRRAAAVARPVREQGCRLPFPGLLDGRASRCFREYTQRLAPPSMWTQSGYTTRS